MPKTFFKDKTARAVSGRMKRTLVALPVLAVLMAVMAAGAGCGTGTDAGEQAGTPQPVTAVRVLTQEYVQELAENRQANPMEVREAVISGEGDRKTVKICVERPETLNDASVIGVMASYGQHVFSNLFEIEEVDSVTITMYGVKQGVKGGEDVAIRLVLNRQDLADVEWSMFGPMTISDMVSEYYVDPAIESAYFNP